MSYDDDDYMTDDERESILDSMFPDRHEPDFNDDDDGYGSLMGN